MTQNLFLDDCPIQLTVEDDQCPNYVVLDLGEKGEDPNDRLTGHSILLRRARDGKGWRLVVITDNGEEVGAMELPANQYA